MSSIAPVYFGGKGPTPIAWNPLPYMEEYLTNLEVDERAKGYIRMVRTGLAHFAIFCHQEAIKNPEQITRQHLLQFQGYLNELTNADGEKLAKSYRQQLMKYVRGWINWMEEVGHIESNPWVRIRVGRVEKKPKPLEDDEVAALFAAHRQQAFSIHPFFYHRREVILTLLLAWGLRLHELRSLTVTALDMRLEWVTVRNKGGNDKVLPFSSEMKQVVARWLVHRSRHQIPGDDSLLIDQQGHQMSDGMVYKIVTELGQRASVRINPHRLRDTFGTIMLDNDVPVERIMKMMGHTNRTQTLAYSRVNEPKVKESHDEVMNPLLHKLLGGELP